MYDTVARGFKDTCPERGTHRGYMACPVVSSHHEDEATRTRFCQTLLVKEVTKAHQVQGDGTQTPPLDERAQSHIVAERIWWEVLLWLFWENAVCHRAALSSTPEEKVRAGCSTSHPEALRAAFVPTESSL